MRRRRTRSVPRRRRYLGLALLLPLVGCGGTEQSPAESADDDLPPAQQGTYLHIVAPSIIKQGEPTELRLRVITQAGLPDYDFEGDFQIRGQSALMEFPENVVVEPMREGWFRMEGLTFGETGVQLLRGTVPQDTVDALANPVNVVADPEYRIFWGDLNGHSDLSSGQKAPGVYFWYAKAVALLDFAVLTDNDREPSLEKELDDVTFAEVTQTIDEERNEDGRLAAFVGFEWTSREHGNRLVIFSEPPSHLPTVAAGYDTPEKLRAALPEGSVVIAAHPSGSALDSPVDPASMGTEDLVEVYSTLGSFEGPGAGRATTRETAGAFVSDLLQRGLRFGLVASSDTRFSLPGNPRNFVTEDHPWPGGLTAVLAKELTRESILEALRARRCYATTGQRFLLEFTVDGSQMGSELRVPSGHRAEAYGSLASTAPWLRVEILGPEGPIGVLNPEGPGADVVELRATTAPVTAPTFVYLRGVDERGGMAWSSPVFLVPE